jgi:hypothetical protein
MQVSLNGHCTTEYAENFREVIAGSKVSAQDLQDVDKLDFKETGFVVSNCSKWSG